MALASLGRTWVGLLVVAAVWWGLVLLAGCDGPAPAPEPPVQPTATAVSTATASPTREPTTRAESTLGLETGLEYQHPVVIVGDAIFMVDVAEKSEERAQGLSGRPSLGEGMGMLFIFEEESAHPFWMKEMQFPLDFLWIDGGCTVADITVDVPQPAEGTELSELPTYRPEVPVKFVLEINAREAAARGISKGDAVAFGGTLNDNARYGC